MLTALPHQRGRTINRVAVCLGPPASHSTPTPTPNQLSPTTTTIAHLCIPLPPSSGCIVNVYRLVVSTVSNVRRYISVTSGQHSILCCESQSQIVRHPESCVAHRTYIVRTSPRKYPSATHVCMPSLQMAAVVHAISLRLPGEHWIYNV